MSQPRSLLTGGLSLTFRALPARSMRDEGSKKKRTHRSLSFARCQELKVAHFEGDENPLTPHCSFVTLRAPVPQ